MPSAEMPVKKSAGKSRPVVSGCNGSFEAPVLCIDTKLSFKQWGCTPWLRGTASLTLKTQRVIHVGDTVKYGRRYWVAETTPGCHCCKVKLVTFDTKKKRCLWMVPKVQTCNGKFEWIRDKAIQGKGDTVGVGGRNISDGDLVWPANTYLWAVNELPEGICEGWYVVCGRCLYKVQNVRDSGCVDERPYLVTIKMPQQEKCD